MEKREEQRDPPEATDAAGAGDGTERDKAVGEGGDKDKEDKDGDKDKDKDGDKEDKDREKEEEEAFLVSLYKFMKERRTPIERIPHLGFKQINLWKIYKAVEKLGAYELVTGRRLWKNVYDELGGSPGSTSAATCTRRHYERLVLPYVRHLKGEEDKPLPPSKPRRQQKGGKEEKSKRRKEKGNEKPAPDKARPEEAAERGRGTDGLCSPVPNPSGGCPSPCRNHGETYKRLLSSFYSSGNHPIMSPLAKKKLLAQVSKAESLHCHKRHCPGAPSLAEQRSPEPPGAPDRARSAGSEAAPAGTDSPAPAVFTGYFHAYRSEGRGSPPLWGCFSGLKDFWEPPSACPARPEELQQPPELRGRAGRPWQGRVQGCWVPPGTPRHQDEDEDEDDNDEDDEEEPLGRTAMTPAVSPLSQEGSDSRSPRGHRALAKPKAVVATAGLAAPDAFTGTAPRFGSAPEPLQGQSVPGVPLLARNPLLIPAFPSPLVVATGTGSLPYGPSCARPRLLPPVPQRSCGSRHCPQPGRP